MLMAVTVAAGMTVETGATRLGTDCVLGADGLCTLEIFVVSIFAFCHQGG
jgi:hypothetical protein